MQGLLLAPIDRGTIFLAKTAANFLFMVAAELFLVPAFVFFFNFDLGITFVRLAPVLLLGTLGFAAIGTLFAAVSLRTRSREIVLPLVMLPLATPMLIASIESSSALLAGKEVAAISHYLRLLVAFDVVFLVTGWLGFEYAVEE
jgi:heme exporter protein B